MAKLNPNYQKFFQNAAAAGYASSEIISFIQNQFRDPQQQAERSSIEQSSTLRPDEAANLRTVQQSEKPMNIAKSIPGAIGRGGAIGTAIGAAPGLISKGMDILSGLGGRSKDIEASALPGAQQPQAPAQQQGYDPLAGLQEFPELIKFIQEEQAKGGNAQSIGSKARKSMRLSTFVNSIEQTAGEEFESVLARLLGQPQQQGQQQQPQSQHPQSAKLDQVASLIQAYKQRKG